VKMEPGDADFLASFRFHPSGLRSVKEDLYLIDPVFWSKNVSKVGVPPVEVAEEKQEPESSVQIEKEPVMEPAAEIEKEPVTEPAPEEPKDLEPAEQPRPLDSSDSEGDAVETAGPVPGLRTTDKGDGWHELRARTLEEYQADLEIIKRRLNDGTIDQGQPPLVADE
ncbi:unnamed protein product, partial [Symbiodinium necroappetens]